MKTLKIGDLLARLPIIQGGMGVGISLSGLASAVANQGGVGVISSAGLGVIYREHSKDYNTASIWGLREELRKAREKTKGIIGVNVMVAMSNFADMVRTAIAEKADIIFSGAGMPLNLPSFLTKGSKTKLAPIVSSARAAKLICEKWLANYKYVPDAIVVEGPKAGGHLGYKPEQITDEHFSLERLLQETFLSSPEQYIEPLLPPDTPRLTVTASDDGAILSMVAGGLGVSVLSAFSLAGYEGRVRVIPLDKPVSRRLGVAVKTLPAANTAARVFLSFLKRQYNGGLPQNA